MGIFAQEVGEVKILMLSWEYPPHVVGGLAAHMQGLSRALVQRGHDVTVITQDAATEREQFDEGVRVLRTPPVPVRSPDFMGFVHQLNQQMLGKALEQMLAGERYDLIHAHDWIVAFAAATLKQSLHLPLIATIHATEFGRNGGLHNDQQRHISDIEWWLIFEAWRVIVCSDSMKGELKHVFQAPDDKVRVIPNGIDTRGLPVPRDMQLRRQYAADDEEIVFFAGRLVFEKGVDVLLYALSYLHRVRPNVHAIIAGKGPIQGELEQLAYQLGIGHRVHFVGHIDAQLRDKLLAISDVAVFPSRYEPFGIVALEAMASHVPVIAGGVGGLAEIISHGEDGFLIHPGDAGALSADLLTLLDDKKRAHRMAQAAAEKVQRKYSWDSVAEQTESLYNEVLAAYAKSDWQASKKVPILAGLNHAASEFERFQDGRYHATGASDL